MGCDIPEERLWSWIDRDASELEEHLAVCPVCAQRAAQIREEIALIAAGTALTIPLPEKIGSYRIIRLLGEGGQALVYEAEQSSPSRRVALKVLKGGCLATKKSIKHFQCETQTLANLQHPAIAIIYEACRTEDGLYYFAMELVAGTPLNKYVQENQLTHRECLKLLHKVCDAVAYAHRHGVWVFRPNPDTHSG